MFYHALATDCCPSDGVAYETHIPFQGVDDVAGLIVFALTVRLSGLDLPPVPAFYCLFLIQCAHRSLCCCP